MNYIVSTRELVWHNKLYKIEANDEEEAEEGVSNGNGICLSDESTDIIDDIKFNWAIKK